MRESDHLEKRDRTKFSSGSIGIADLFFTASGLLTLCAVRKNSRKVSYQEDFPWLIFLIFAIIINGVYFIWTSSISAILCPTVSSVVLDGSAFILTARLFEIKPYISFFCAADFKLPQKQNLFSSHAFTLSQGRRKH